MSNELLDSPINENKSIRKRYFSVLEFTIIILNGLFLLVGVGSCWATAFDTGYLLYLINPTVFILIFSLPPILFVWKWRKASLNYDTFKQASEFKTISNNFLTLVLPISAIGWTLVAIIVGFFLFFIVADASEDEQFISFLAALLLMAPIITLGPAQYFFIKKIKKIMQEISEKD